MISITEKLGLALIFIMGGSIAVVTHTLRQPEPDRVAMAMAMFHSYCVALANGRPNTLEPPFRPLKDAGDGSQVWADSVTGIALHISPTGCGVHDMFAPMNAVERQAFFHAAVRLTARDLPMLRQEDNQDLGWDLFTAWMEHPRDDPRRWGAILFRVAPSGEHASTHFIIKRPDRENADDPPQGRDQAPVKGARSPPAGAAPGAR